MKALKNILVLVIGMALIGFILSKIYHLQQQARIQRNSVTQQASEQKIIEPSEKSQEQHTKKSPSHHNAVSSEPSQAPKTIRSEHLNTQLAHLIKKAPTLKKDVLKIALQAYHTAVVQGGVNKPILTVIDYSLPSNRQRMWIFDLAREKLLFNTYVAHGQNSGMTTPTHFSNQPSSKATSLGTYVTRDTYYGSKGLSLNLKGLEHGFNDNAYNRRVVIHGAWYVEPDFIKSTGRAGRSWGCPSIAKTIAAPIINTLKGGSVLFAYSRDRNYLSHSKFIG